MRFSSLFQYSFDQLAQQMNLLIEVHLKGEKGASGHVLPLNLLIVPKLGKSCLVNEKLLRMSAFHTNNQELSTLFTDLSAVLRLSF